MKNIGPTNILTASIIDNNNVKKCTITVQEKINPDNS